MRLFAALVLAMTAALPAAAEAIVTTDHARSRLVAEQTGIAPGGNVRLALHQTLQAGWHVYWKNPGDSGLPLETIWALPINASVSAVEYPAPERIEIGPLVNYGHEGEPVFLATLTAPANAQPGSTLAVGLEATWLICAEICVPETASFSIALPVVAAPLPDANASAIFAAADAAAPRPASASFRIEDGNIAIEAASLGNGATGAYFFPEADSVIAPAAVQRFEQRGGALRLTAPALSTHTGPLAGVILVETKDGAAAFAVSATADASIDVAAAASAAPRNAAPVPPPTAAALPGLLLAALLGGAFLNLMPCVFPILFVKAASFAAAGTDARLMRRHGLLYAAGVIATFAVLGGALLGLRAAGEGLGWGFHLQSPFIVALSAYVLFAVGLNLAGAFSVGDGLQNVGSGLVSSAKGDGAAFLTGVLAVFVAAPCVGPFLTAPIGAAAVLPP
ncbi:MAG: protein-disulfide reductase DsbD domain-containing protein, partial [Parvularculaceae bacterium]